MATMYRFLGMEREVIGYPLFLRGHF